jgi:hypothetical protein
MNSLPKFLCDGHIRYNFMILCRQCPAEILPERKCYISRTNIGRNMKILLKDAESFRVMMFLSTLHMCALGVLTDFQTVLHLLPSGLQHPWCNSSQAAVIRPRSSFTSCTFLWYTKHLMYPHRNKSKRAKYGDLRGHVIGPRLPICLPRNR